MAYVCPGKLFYGTHYLKTKNKFVLSNKICAKINVIENGNSFKVVLATYFSEENMIIE